MQFVDFKLQKNIFIILLMWYQLYYVLIYIKKNIVNLIIIYNKKFIYQVVEMSGMA